MAVILYRNRTIANNLTAKVSVLPSFVWLKMGPVVKPGESSFVECVGDPDGSPNVVSIPEDVQGRCLQEHGLSDEDVTCLQDAWADEFASGDVQLLDKIPEDWVSKAD